MWVSTIDSLRDRAGRQDSWLEIPIAYLSQSRVFISFHYSLFPLNLSFFPKCLLEAYETEQDCLSSSLILQPCSSSFLLTFPNLPGEGFFHNQNQEER